MLSLAAMAKFADEGFRFVGHAPLSRAPLRPKFVRTSKEAAFSATAAAAAAAPAQPLQRGADFPSDIVTYPPASGGGSGAPSQLLKVEIMRGDPQGNVYYKT